MKNGCLLFMLLKQPILHTFYAVCHKPCSAMIAACKMGKQQMVTFSTHFVCFLGELFLWQRHIPCCFCYLATLTTPQFYGLSLQ